MTSPSTAPCGPGWSINPLAFVHAPLPRAPRDRATRDSVLRASSSRPAQPATPCHASSRALSRRAALTLGAAALVAPALPSVGARAAEGAEGDGADESGVVVEPLTRSPADAKVTDRVYIDMKVGGKVLPRVVIGLFGNDAPHAVESFRKVCNGELRGRGGRTVGYAYSQGWRVVKGERVDLGRVKQIDEINQSPGTPQRQLVLIEVPEHRDINDIAHLIPGTVSIRRGGGQFEFTITPNAAPEGSLLDQENLVIGRVLEGMDAIAALDVVPTNQKTARDGFRNVGKVIGDGRAKLDLEYKPLQKIVIAASGTL